MNQLLHNLAKLASFGVWFVAYCGLAYCWHGSPNAPSQPTLDSAINVNKVAKDRPDG